MTIIVAVFFPKLRVVLGSCFGMHRLNVTATAGPEAFPFLPFALSLLGKSRLQPFAGAASCSHTM